MSRRTIRPARGEPMLPRPAISTSAIDFMSNLLVFRPPRRSSVKSGRMLAETAGGGIGPARSRPASLLRLGDLVEPAATTGTLDGLLVVSERPPADGTGRPMRAFGQL